jgi:hypothetical protein
MERVGVLTQRGPRQGAACGGAITASSEGVYNCGR